VCIFPLCSLDRAPHLFPFIHHVSEFGSFLGLFAGLVGRVVNVSLSDDSVALAGCTIMVDGASGTGAGAGKIYLHVSTVDSHSQRGMQASSLFSVWALRFYGLLLE